MALVHLLHVEVSAYPNCGLALFQGVKDGQKGLKE